MSEWCIKHSHPFPPVSMFVPDQHLNPSPSPVPQGHAIAIWRRESTADLELTNEEIRKWAIWRWFYHVNEDMMKTTLNHTILHAWSFKWMWSIKLGVAVGFPNCLMGQQTTRMTSDWHECCKSSLRMILSSCRPNTCIRNWPNLFHSIKKCNLTLGSK